MSEVFWLVLGIFVGLGASYIYLNLFPRVERVSTEVQGSTPS